MQQQVGPEHACFQFCSDCYRNPCKEIEKERKLRAIITSPIAPARDVRDNANAEACPSQSQIVRSEGQTLNQDEELLFFLSGQVLWDGNCSSGLMAPIELHTILSDSEKAAEIHTATAAMSE